MAKKSNSGNNGGGVSALAFWIIIIGGIAMALAYCLSFIDNSQIRSIALTAVKICGLIAWLIVMVFGWNIAKSRKTGWKVAYLLCCLAVLVFSGFIWFNVGIKFW